MGMVGREGFLFIVVMWLLVACGGTTPGDLGNVNNCYFRTDRGWIIKWRELPIPVYAHVSLSKIERKNFLYAMDMWNEAWNYHTGKGVLFEFMGDTDMTYVPKEEDDGINILYLDKGHYFLTDQQQGTTFTKNDFGGNLTEADIIINGIHYEWYYEKEAFDYSAYTQVPELSTGRSLASTSETTFWGSFMSVIQSLFRFLAFWNQKMDVVGRLPSAEKPKIKKGQVDFISVALHEFGHKAALGHIEGTKSIMNPHLGGGVLRRDITKLELGSLACGYQMKTKGGRSLASVVEKRSVWQKFWSYVKSWL